MSSLVYQVESVFRAIARFGMSRHAAKRRGDADQYIFSYKTMEKYLGLAILFALWDQRQYGIRRLGDVTPAMVTAFMAMLKTEPLSSGKLRSPNTINSYLDAIQKLDTALRAMGWRRQNAPPLVDPALRVRHGPPRPTPFSPQEARDMIARLQQHPDPRVAKVAEAMQRGGLRLDEALRLRVSEIQPDRLVLDGHSTKNGRPREIPLADEAAAFFQALKSEAVGRALVFDTARLRRLVQRAVWQAAADLGLADRRAHNLRSHFAKERYRELTERGVPERQAKRAVASDLGHGRTSVLRNYCGQ